MELIQVLILLFLYCSCSFSIPHHVVPRIIGGDEVEITDYPYQVSVEYYEDHKCGGTILNETYIITAAHCTEGIGAGAFRVRAGSSILEQDGQVIYVAQKYEHPEYNNITHANDICLLKLKQPLNFNENVSPISLPKSNQRFSIGTDVTVSGWGVTSAKTANNSAHLRAANIQIVDYEKCRESYLDKDLIVPNTTLCAGDTFGRDACHGDSGGPLVQNHVLVGVVSYGLTCGDPHFPGIYTNVSQFRSFIGTSSASTSYEISIFITLISIYINMLS